MTGWFGIEVADWKHLRTYRIRLALPARRTLEPASLPVRRKPGLYFCGDHRDTPSLQGAMTSGRRAAAALLEDREKAL
jgi:predicted NAD/FAD-dependent oxidoreductase